MSHHLDTPHAHDNGQLYIDDLYVFGTDHATMFVMDVNSTITGPDVQPGFHHEARYEIKVHFDNADVYGKTSPDGITWSPGIGAPVPNQHAGPFVTCLTDGRLLATSCSNRLSLSTDSGLTWTEILAPFPELGQVFSWPALYQTAPHQIAAMTTRSGVNLRWGTLPQLSTDGDNTTH